MVRNLLLVAMVRACNGNGYCGGFDITDQTSGSTCMSDSGSQPGCYNLIYPPNGGSSCWYDTYQSQCCGHGHCSSQYDPYYNNCICDSGYSGAACDQAPLPPPVNCIGAWGNWNGCSATCGGGSQSRTYIITQYASNGGSDCSSANGDTQSQSCGSEACPPNPEPGPEPAPEPVSICETTVQLGVPMQGTIVSAGTSSTYCVGMVGGVTYQIEVALASLPDSIVAVYDIATGQQLAMDDDGGEGYGSFLEWTSPASTTYQIVVTGYSTNTGTFDLTVVQVGGDPCAGGVSFTHSEGVILFSNAYDAGAECLWTVSCEPDALVTLTFEQFATEYNYDFVNVLDGPLDTSSQLAHLSGNMNNLGDQTQIQSTSSVMTVQFTSDGSINGLGFEASWVCTLEVCLEAGDTVQGSVDDPGTDTRYCLDVNNAGETFLIQVLLTGSLTESVLKVYSPGGSNVLATNGDNGAGYGSTLEFSAPYPARFVIAVEGYGSNTGSYSLSVGIVQGDACISPGLMFTQSEGDIFW